MHDNDSKYTQPFLNAFKTAKISTQRTAIKAPNTVAYIERWVQSIKQECLDHFVVVGRSHMNFLCEQYRQHYLLERPHQGKDNEWLVTPKRRKQSSQESETIRLNDIHCGERLGGLLKSYSRKAA